MSNFDKVNTPAYPISETEGFPLRIKVRKVPAYESGNVDVEAVAKRVYGGLFNRYFI